MNKDQIIAKTLKLNLTIAIYVLIIGFILQLFTVNQSHYLSNEVINAGLLYVIFMPILRIILEFTFFLKTKNYTYIVICLLLFIVIAISIVC